MPFQALQKAFADEHWSELKEPDSILYRFFLLEIFQDKSKGQEQGQLDADTLRMLGLLHCECQNTDKAAILYGFIELREGKKLIDITKDNPIFKPLLYKLCILALKGTLRAA